MFSRLDREQCSNRKANAQQNLLDILQRIGVQVQWRDNNSDSKGVALRVPHSDFRKHRMAGLCTSDSCFDEVLLDGLDSMLEDSHGDRILVLSSEENTSELQSLMSRSFAVFGLKKKTIRHKHA